MGFVGVIKGAIHSDYGNDVLVKQRKSYFKRPEISSTIYRSVLSSGNAFSHTDEVYVTH